MTLNRNSELGNQNSELRLLLVMSSSEELRPFLRLVNHRRAAFSDGRGWTFQGRGFAGLAVLVGMGGSLPRVLTARAISACHPDMVITAGFGGAVTAVPPRHGVLVASECWRLTLEDRLTPVAYSPPVSPEALATRLRHHGLPVATGAVVTTQVIRPKASLPREVFRLPHPVLDMETAEIAAVAQTHHLPCLAVRTISDSGGEEIQPFLADIVNTCQGVPLSRLLPALLADPRRVLHCLHLWRRAGAAGGNLATALRLIIAYLTQHQN